MVLSQLFTQEMLTDPESVTHILSRVCSKRKCASVWVSVWLCVTVCVWMSMWVSVRVCVSGGVLRVCVWVSVWMEVCELVCVWVCKWRCVNECVSGGVSVCVVSWSVWVCKWFVWVSEWVSEWVLWECVNGGMWVSVCESGGVYELRIVWVRDIKENVAVCEEMSQSREKCI